MRKEVKEPTEFQISYECPDWYDLEKVSDDECNKETPTTCKECWKRAIENRGTM